MTLTAQPWAFTPDAVTGARRQGFSPGQLESAVGVIAMFNYYTRVADASGIEFDYPTPLPTFEPDRCQVMAPRPSREAAPDRSIGSRRRPADEGFGARWESWRTYVMDSDEPIGRRERRLLASVAAEETTDWEGAGALGGSKPAEDGDEALIAFARKLSRQPWSMEETDLKSLRSAGYQEQAVLHVISVVAHQNADSRLALGLAAMS